MAFSFLRFGHSDLLSLSVMDDDSPVHPFLLVAGPR
jgi:hypothetical protein